MWTHTGNLRRRPKDVKDRIATIGELEETTAPLPGSGTGEPTSPLAATAALDSSEEGNSSQDETENQPSDAAYAARIAGRRKGGAESAPLGVTLSGFQVFPIPALHDATHRLLYKFYSLPSLATWTGLFFSIFATVYYQSPQLLLALACFWRIGCNLGLGLLLKHQSAHSTLTVWMQALRDRPPSWFKRAIATLLRQHTRNGGDLLDDRTIPPSFPAWVALRSVVNILEHNDVLAFTLTAVLFGQTERDASPYGAVVLSLSDLVGLVLITISLYSKLDARKTGGDYAWYWGDFFFLRMGDVELHSGVFDIFPHPMYTVGYAWTYGCAIWARSTTVLSLAFAFHISQLAFLTFVEVPHIEKLYSPAQQKLAPQEEYSWVTLAMTVFFFVSSVVLGSRNGGPLDDDNVIVLMALFWQVLANVVKGFILVQQERAKFWTLYFKSKGKDSMDAYRSWQGLFRLLQYLSHAAFHLCAMRLFWMPPSWTQVFSGNYVSCMLCGVLLVGVSLWSFTSCYEELGDYGWYYGDFFYSQDATAKRAKRRIAARSPVLLRGNSREGIDSGCSTDEDNFEESVEQDVGAEATEMRPSYNSIYKYINNPEVYLGHLWMYGYALLCSSRDLCAVAILSHAMKIAFLHVVEEPHLRQVYKEHVRKHTPLGAAIARRGEKIRSNEKAMFLINWSDL